MITMTSASHLPPQQNAQPVAHQPTKSHQKSVSAKKRAPIKKGKKDIKKLKEENEQDRRMLQQLLDTSDRIASASEDIVKLVKNLVSSPK